MTKLFKASNLILALAIFSGGKAFATPFTASCDNGALTISQGQYVAVPGSVGNIPISIQVNDGAIGNYFEKAGYSPSGLSAGCDPYADNCQNGYSIYIQDQATRWEIHRNNNGVKVEAFPNQGDSRQSVNWFYQNCTFGN
jgi:hypothetical protein